MIIIFIILYIVSFRDYQGVYLDINTLSYDVINHCLISAGFEYFPTHNAATK